MITTVTRFKTSDGKLFENENEAKHHETRGKAELALDQFFAEYFDRTSSAQHVRDQIKGDAKFTQALLEHLHQLGYQ